MKFNVRFTISRFPLRNMYRAIEKVEPGFLFPNLEKDAENKTEEAMIKSYFNRDIENNFEQKTAVRLFYRKSQQIQLELYWYSILN